MSVRPEELALAFRQGDEIALRQVYDAWGGMVLRFCARSLPSQADAEDVTQQVFVAAWRGREGFDAERGELPAWLLGIARHKVVDRLRTGQQIPTPVDAVPEQTPQPAESEQIAERLLVAAALMRLPDEQRTALHLAFFEGCSHDEVASRLGVPLGTAKSHIRRGLQRLRRALPAEGGAT